jgi:integrase
VVRISRALRFWLDRYAPRPTFGGWYFPNPQGMRYDPDNFSGDLARFDKANGIVLTCLDYRHTFGSQRR